LQVFLHGFKEYVSNATWSQYRKEPSRIARNIFFLAEGLEEGLRAEPQDSNRYVEQREDDEGSLKNDAQIVAVLASSETR
jgi:hypothetical protein